MDRRKFFSALLALPLFAAASEAVAQSSLPHHSFRQRGNSMQPTIEPGDVVSLTLGRPTFDASRKAGSLVLDRGDLLAFTTPRWPGAAVIFRLIGLPGEIITVFDEQVLIDGKPLKHEEAGAAPSDPSYYVDNPAPGRWPEYESMRFVVETLPNGVSYKTLCGKSLRASSYRGKLRSKRRDFSVPTGSTFLMGDNRDDANDSRFDVGLVSLTQVIGKVVAERT